MRFLPILAAITIGLFAATAANAQGMSTGMRSQTMGTMSQGMDRPMMKKKMSKKRMMRMKRMKMMGTSAANPKFAHVVLQVGLRTSGSKAALES